MKTFKDRLYKVFIDFNIDTEYGGDFESFFKEYFPEIFEKINSIDVSNNTGCVDLWKLEMEKICDFKNDNCGSCHGTDKEQAICE